MESEYHNKLFSNFNLMYSQYQSTIGLNFASSYDSAGRTDRSEVEYKYINFNRDINTGID
ncbi:MAG: hypothetical protein R2852_02125 [Bacteroidia bacterium]